MLDGLDEVDWDALTHAYGAATDVPDLIRALSSNDVDERCEAFEVLFTNIWHQGTVYEATAVAVPFLVGLLADSRVGGKEGILQLLASIAQGGSFIDAHAGILDQAGMGTRTEDERLDRDSQRARELGYVRAGCAAVEAGVWTYLELLADDEPEVRIAAAFTLGQCRGRASQVISELLARVAAETDGVSQAALILAINALAPGAWDTEEANRFFAERIGPTEPPVVRLASAMCLVKSSLAEPAPEVLDILAVSIGPAWNDFSRLPWRRATPS